MKKSDLKLLSTEEIIELVRSHRRIENVKIKNDEDRKALLAEIIRRQGEDIPNSILKDILTSSLPAYPNGDYSKRSLHIRLANATTLEDDDGRDWTDFSEADIIHLFQLSVDSSRPFAPEISRSLYTEIWYRNLQKKISDSEYFIYIRKQIPSDEDPDFRKWAFKLIEIMSN